MLNSFLAVTIYQRVLYHMNTNGQHKNSTLLCYVYGNSVSLLISMYSIYSTLLQEMLK